MDRPTITPRESQDPNRVNDVVSWFIDNESGLKEKGTDKLTFRAFLLVGYQPREIFKEGKSCVFSKSLTSTGFRNMTTLSIYEKLMHVLGTDARPSRHTFQQTLEGIYANLRSYVLFLRKYDASNTDLPPLLGRLEMFFAERQEQLGKILRELNPPISSQDLLDVAKEENLSARWSEIHPGIHDMRAILQERFLTSDREKQLASIYISKTFLEVIFYILCWFYYCWFDEQYYAPPLQEKS